MPVTLESLNEVMVELKRLVNVCGQAKKVLKKDDGYDHPKEIAAVKRSSMDVTRVLVKLRTSPKRND